MTTAVTSANVAAAPAAHSPVLDGGVASSVLRPETETDAVDAVRGATADGCALVPLGGGLSVQQGNRLRASRWAALRTSAMAELLEFSAEDMVVTAGAGMTLSALQSILAEQNQFLPVDAPFPGQATLGGIVATNAHGLWRPAFGAPRDRLLGARAVLADGSVVRAGGKVVKNVAGYDLCKLFAGSWGTLGFITEVTFKTNPLPPARRQLTFRATNGRSAVDAALALHAARLQPVSSTVSTFDGTTLTIGLMGSMAAVEWQAEQIGTILTEHGLERVETPLKEETLRQAVAEEGSSITARVTARPTDVAAVLDVLSYFNARAVAMATVGVVDAALGAGFAFTDAETLRAKLPEGANLVWTRIPDDCKTDIDVWGPVRNDFALMRGIKSALDPAGLFSPGRFVGRL